ncbi:MAG: GTPase HflX [Candidatus Roizmanbacteria bacterium]|nr:GTPase HflX [Candidatus Roizmanbacteria bacterium]
MHQQTSKKYILVDVIPPSQPKEEAEQYLAETLSLIRTFGGGSVVKIIQRRDNPHGGTYIGTGKAEEIAEMIKNLHIDTVIVNGVVKSSQLFNLTKMYWESNSNIEVWDRIDLILHIFEKHARTAEAKLQIELAKMKHMGPRMYGLSEELGRQAGGIGGRGVGETNVELMKRHWREQINRTKSQLNKLSKGRTLQIERRRQQGFQTASIVGYTNAGKTSLFNILTNKKKLTRDALFATLDTVVGHMYLPEINKRMLITDTIGFIRQLPPTLIVAFKSTLLESVYADILIHVIDASDPLMSDKIQTVQELLVELGIGEKPAINVYNKADNLTEERIMALKKKDGVVISVKEQAGIEVLIKTIQTKLFG